MDNRARSDEKKTNDVGIGAVVQCNKLRLYSIIKIGEKYEQVLLSTFPSRYLLNDEAGIKRGGGAVTDSTAPGKIRYCRFQGKG